MQKDTQDLKLTFLGTLTGVSFRKAGSFFNKETNKEQPYGDALNLNFGYLRKKVIDDLESVENGTFTVKVPVSNQAELKVKLAKYNKLVGKDISINFNNFHGMGFSADDEDIQILPSK